MAVKSMERKKKNDDYVDREGHKSKVWLYLVLLTLQYGAQPLLSKRFSGKEVIVTSSVLACECAKVLCALTLMVREGSLARLTKEWSLLGSLTASGLPAAIYALQNSLLQLSYRNLDSLTFTMLNQTKLFFTALFMYLILRQKQSVQQVGALFLLIIAALLLSIGEGSGRGSGGVDPEQALFLGIIPVIVASVLSGLASSLCQWASQVKKRSSYLMTIEMSAIGSLCLLASTLKSPDGEAIKQQGFFSGWTIFTLIPILTNAVGGILVGLVTTQAGGVRKVSDLACIIMSRHGRTNVSSDEDEMPPPRRQRVVRSNVSSDDDELFARVPVSVRSDVSFDSYEIIMRHIVDGLFQKLMRYSLIVVIHT